MKKISIIVPAYNVENYIEQCLNSIVNQNMSGDLEVIIINDGSTDKTLSLCRKFVDKNDGWIIVDQKNGGISSARNRGLEIATGEYIAFLDSDDYFLKNVLEDMYKIAKENNSDIVISKLNAFNSLGSYGYYSDRYILENKSFNFKEYRRIIKAMSVCGKLFKKELAKSNRFIVGIVHEDNYYSIVSYVKSDIITTFNKYTYYRRIREGGELSITQNLSLKTYLNLLDNFYQSIVELTEYDSFNFVVSFCVKSSLRYIVNNISKDERKNTLKKHFEFIKKLKENSLISYVKYMLYNIISHIYYIFGLVYKGVRKK